MRKLLVNSVQVMTVFLKVIICNWWFDEYTILVTKSVSPNIGSFHTFSELFGLEFDNAELDVMSIFENILIYSTCAIHCRWNQQTCSARNFMKCQVFHTSLQNQEAGRHYSTQNVHGLGMMGIVQKPTLWSYYQLLLNLFLRLNLWKD
jgi:hypothetical protein